MEFEDGTGSRHPRWRCGSVAPPDSTLSRLRPAFFMRGFIPSTELKSERQKVFRSHEKKCGSASRPILFSRNFLVRARYTPTHLGVLGVCIHLKQAKIIKVYIECSNVPLTIEILIFQGLEGGTCFHILPFYGTFFIFSVPEHLFEVLFRKRQNVAGFLRMFGGGCSDRKRTGLLKIFCLCNSPVLFIWFVRIASWAVSLPRAYSCRERSCRSSP